MSVAIVWSNVPAGTILQTIVTDIERTSIGITKSTS